ncbi:Vacuolar protein sorting-associated protein ist1 [Paramarasmius palmivorus]|uniref:Vacuolar protein sorting-associated protein ist1 n=1 Tax=Paramarasmius palmivorus TaxID=297713 RepID=A0AAW0E755_9AGAR
MHVINEDIHIELLELLELYCELLLARFGVLDQNAREPDPGVSEGVCSIIYAAPRTELKELHVLRDILMHKYGREFAVKVMENDDNCVSDRVVRKLEVLTPSSDLVEAYMAEIAKAYGADYRPLLPKHEAPEGTGDSEGNVKESPQEPGNDDKTTEPITIKLPEAKDGLKDTPKLPDIPPTEDEGDEKAKENKADVKPAKAAPAPPPEDDFEALTKRFAALKKR